MARVLQAVLIAVLLSSCSGISPLGLLSGGGPNVAANTQIGKENNQNVGVTTYIKPELRPEGPVENLTQDNSTTNNPEIDPLLLILLVLGWLAPSPQEIGRGISRWLRDLTSRR